LLPSENQSKTHPLPQVVLTKADLNRMATQVIMPKLSPTMEEGQLSRWLKKEGDKVSMGEPLAEIDTDKATMEMQALGNGVLRKILIQEGESAPLGQLIAIIGEPDEDISALTNQAAPAQTTKAPDKSETARTEVTACCRNCFRQRTSRSSAATSRRVRTIDRVAPRCANGRRVGY
jgi:pyruvate/2-oxoglutarate dehydrogenase complex dihydrolipoamide acyltransferase (E2) component